MEQGRYMRNAKRKKRGKKLLATAAFLATVFSVAAVICLAMFFSTEEILVTGSARYSSEEIVAASGITKGQNIFAVSPTKASAALYNAFPYLNEVKVARLLPTTIQITVVETAPALSVVSSSKSYTLLGANDRLLEQIDDVSTEGIPIILGVDLTSIAPGTNVNRRTLDELYYAVSEDDTLRPQLELMNTALGKLSTAKTMLRIAQELEFTDISYYDVSDELSVSLLYDNRIVVMLGSELQLDYKMKFAQRVIDELGDSFTGSVDLSTAANNQRSYTMEQNIEPLINAVYREGYY